MMSIFPTDSVFLKGHGLKAGDKIARRMSERHKRIIEHNLEYIEGHSILDLASNNGRWSYAALQAGASSVLGIEGRQVLIDRGLPDFARFDSSRYRFVCGDIYDMCKIAKAEGKGSFDTVLCLGIFYHITDHYRLLRLMRNFNPHIIIIDSSFLKMDEPVVRFRVENSLDPSMAIPEGEQESALSGIASLGFLRQTARLSGYDVTIIPWTREETDFPESVDDYLNDSKKARRFTVQLTARADKPVW